MEANTAISKAGNGRALLKVLPEDASLRTNSPFLEITRWPPDQENEAPRALRGLARIVDGGLCHRCGSCIGICPTGVLGLDDQHYPKVVSLSSCTDCDLCVKVCPGDEFNYNQMHSEVLTSPGDPVATHGHFIDSAIGYATDPEIRNGSTSGGVVTAILVDLLEHKEIDGAIVILSDEKELWKGRPTIARTKDELIQSMKSKYAISPTNQMFSEVRALPGKYALVGLPCQIHGFHKAAKLDSRISERVVLTIGLFCHAAVEHDAFQVIWQSLGEKGKSAKRFISRIGKHPGTPYIELDDDTMYPVYFGDKKGYRPSSIEMINILYRLYTPDRCMTCFDSTSEFADIAVGDPWMTPPEGDVNFYDGWSFVLARTKRGKRVYDELVSRGKIGSREVTRREALASNSLMATEKRWRAFRVIETHRRQGRPIPSYGIESPKHSLKEFIKTEIHMMTHMFCYLPRYRAAVLHFILGNGGYVLLWLNHKRRVLRWWIRDILYRVRCAVFGRQ